MHSEASMTGLRLTLLGSFQATRDGAPITRFGGEKVRALLAYLAIEAEQPHTRATLAALLWPELSAELALRNLSQSLVRLREALSEPADGALLQITRQTIAWRAAAAVDVAAFLRLATSGALADLEQAAALYRGELLAGFSLAGCDAFEEWLLLTRERLQGQALAAIERLAELYAAAGRHADAAGAARRQLALDPWREPAYRQLMRALAAGGDRAAALAAYERCRQLLLAELGVEPDQLTTMLAEQVRQAQTTASPPRRPAFTVPAPLTPLLGREEELAALDVLLRGHVPLVTVVGPGGVGKTRLALAAAGVLRHAFADGVCWAPLAGLAAAPAGASGGEELAGVVLAAYGQTSGAGRSPADELCAYLRQRTTLLVLDNCEHLPTLGALVGELLAAAPGLRVLATSRTRLGVYGEQLLALEGLPVPADDGAEATGHAAVQLFLARARRQVRGFGADQASLAGVVRLCRLVEGLPLAIELAAHWVGEYSPDELASAISTDLALLELRDRHAPDRHRSMRAVFDHSWGLLAADERRALARLAVFAGGFDREAALAVAEVRATTLASLVEKSLLRRAGAGRYSLHELLRQFAAEQLAARGDDAATRDRHGQHYLALAEQGAVALVGPQRAGWVTLLDGEYRNLMAALAWLRERRLLGQALRLLGSLVQFWRARGLLREAHRNLTQLLDLSSEVAVATEDRALGYYAAGVLANALGDQRVATQQIERSITLYQSVADAVGAARSRNTLGGIAYDTGDLRAATTLWKQVAASMRAVNNLGEVARVVANIGEALYHQGELAAAQQHYEEGLALARRSGRVDIEATVLAGMGNLARSIGDLEHASAFQTDALGLWQALGERRQIAICLEHLAAIAAAEGRAARAARLLGAAIAQRHQIGAPPARPEQAEVEQTAAAVRSDLGEALWAVEFGAGGQFTLAAALNFALADAQPRAASVPARAARTC